MMYLEFPGTLQPGGGFDDGHLLVSGRISDDQGQKRCDRLCRQENFSL